MAKLNWSKVRQPCFIWGKAGEYCPSERVVKTLTDPDNPKSGYHRVTGNRKALRQLARFAEGVLRKWDHDAGSKAIALVGPSSSGKTWTTESHAMVLGLPFVEVAPEFPTADKLFDIIRTDLKRQGLDVVRQQVEADQPYHYVLPPCVVFIDEAHAVKMKLQKGVLLKAIDDADRSLILSDGTKVATVKVHWVVGTTHFYTLFAPLRNRFTVIKLVSHTKAELAEMTRKQFKLADDVAERVAHYSRLPREAKSFVKALKEYEASTPDVPLMDLVEEVARDKGIDELGLYSEQVEVLRALSKGPVGKDTLPSLTGIEPTELDNEWLPGLLISTPDMPALVKKTPRGYDLTDAGRVEFDKRAALAA